MRLIDLTTDITPDTVVYPGDPKFSTSSVSTIGKSCSFNLSLMSLGNHTGTHIDFPAHVLKNGKTSDNYDLKELSGKAYIIDVPDNHKSISKHFVQSLDIEEGAIIFFKTKNKSINKQKPYKDEYVFIEPEAATELLKLKPKIVGIDYISVDSSESDKLQTHNILLSNDILIIENLELNKIDAGIYMIFIAPLKIPKMDGLPVRVFAINNW